MQKKVIITVGGTGGHIYPAMALAHQLMQDPNLTLRFAGGGLCSNRYFQCKGLPFQDISCGTFSLKKPLDSLYNASSILHGLWQSYCLFKDFTPDLIVGFGSHHTLPVLLAAKLRGIPILLHEANRVPGKVNRWLSRYAVATGVHFSDTVPMLQGKVLEVTIPLRDGYQLGTITQRRAREYFQLDPKMLTLLVFGGSQGAHALNRLVSEALLQVDHSGLQVLHFTGDAQAAQQLQNLYDNNKIKALVKAFEARMDIAWQAADVMVSRSGAGSLAEALEFEVPGILIPYPYATDNHQESNANFMVDAVKGAIKRKEKDLTAKLLAQDLQNLLENNHQRLESLQQNIREYKHRAKPRTLCSVVREHLQLDQCPEENENIS